MSRTASAVDVKAQGIHGKILGHGAGDNTLRDPYLDHVHALPAHRKPHLVVVSGDIAEMGDPDLYHAAQPRFDRLETMLPEHPHPALQPGKDGRLPPRLPLVGGNHDVNCLQVYFPNPGFMKAWRSFPLPIGARSWC
jgi:hypothetical protein